MIRTALTLLAAASLALPGLAFAQDGKVGEGKDNKAKKLQPGPDREIKLVIDQKLAKTKGTVEFIGSKKGAFVEGFFKKDSAPDFWYSTEEVDLKAAMSVMAPLPAGLHYVVIVNQDGQPLPGKADLVSTPVELPAGADKKESLTVIVDQKFQAVLDGDFRTKAYPSGSEPLGVGDKDPATKEELEKEQKEREEQMAKEQAEKEKKAAAAKAKEKKETDKEE